MLWKRCIVLILTMMGIILSIYYPSFLNDDNTFLLNFVNHEFLGFMGVIVTITLASCTSLLIDLHRLEVVHGDGSFAKTRKDVKDSAFFMILCLFLSVIVVVVKPLFNGTSIIPFINAFSLLLIFGCIMLLLDITQAAFTVAPLVGKASQPPISELRNSAVEPTEKQVSKK